MDAHDSSVAVRAVLFDFFGTLVTYEPDRARLEYQATHGLLGSWGSGISYDEFVAAWDAASQQLEAESARTMREFDMTDAARAFSDRLGLDLAEPKCERLGAVFVDEWQRHVRPVPGAGPMIRRLSGRVRVGVVSNTHDRSMVPRLLDQMGVADVIDPVVVSVQHGWKKPHPSIYAAALDAVSAPADRVVFVGDNHEADFAGPRALGMASYLIDPTAAWAVPADCRLGSVLEIEPILIGGARIPDLPA